MALVWHFKQSLTVHSCHSNRVNQKAHCQLDDLILWTNCVFCAQKQRPLFSLQIFIYYRIISLHRSMQNLGVGKNSPENSLVRENFIHNAHLMFHFAPREQKKASSIGKVVIKDKMIKMLKGWTHEKRERVERERKMRAKKIKTKQ